MFARIAEHSQAKSLVIQDFTVLGIILFNLFLSTDNIGKLWKRVKVFTLIS